MLLDLRLNNLSWLIDPLFTSVLPPSSKGLDNHILSPRTTDRNKTTSPGLKVVKSLFENMF